MDKYRGVKLENEQRKSLLLQLLNNKEINFPSHPDNKSSGGPRQWLLRGEMSANRLFQGNPFIPQSGQMGTHGVFLGDCLSSITSPSSGGVYYLFPSSRLAERWLVSPSEEYYRLLNQVAREND